MPVSRPRGKKSFIATLVSDIGDTLKADREYNAKKRRDYQKYFGHWWSRDWKPEHVYLDANSNVHFDDRVRDEFEKCLEKYGEGAFVVLTLLFTLEYPRKWSGYRSALSNFARY